MTANAFAPLLERFFTQRLMTQCNASPHTIAAYRDTFRLFLRFASERLHRPLLPCSLIRNSRSDSSRTAALRIR